MTRPEDKWYGRATPYCSSQPTGTREGFLPSAIRCPESRALSKSVNCVGESMSEKLNLNSMTMRVFAADLQSCASPGRAEEEEEGGIPRMSRRRRGAENEWAKSSNIGWITEGSEEWLTKPVDGGVPQHVPRQEFETCPSSPLLSQPLKKHLNWPSELHSQSQSWATPTLINWLLTPFDFFL